MAQVMSYLRVSNSGRANGVGRRCTSRAGSAGIDAIVSCGNLSTQKFNGYIEIYHICDEERFYSDVDTSRGKLIS